MWIDCLVCGCCFHFIGSIEIQIGRKLYLQGLGSPKDDSFNEKLELLMLEKLELPHSKKFPLPGVINCPGGCKEVYYCW
ncbi:putative histone-lysine N-methyltransferase [Helianthus annuus]|nr:putative [histone H3]-lysine(4) N-trimethyltransferase [Helianthus annuus]KAJ0951018.1 putative histone-lysine N-methyltransferase [Helianthus annuus]